VKRRGGETRALLQIGLGQAGVKSIGNAGMRVRRIENRCCSKRYVDRNFGRQGFAARDAEVRNPISDCRRKGRRLLQLVNRGFGDLSIMSVFLPDAQFQTDRTVIP